MRLPKRHITAASIRRHETSAITLLRVRIGDPPRNDQPYDDAAGHLRAVADALKLTDAEVCDRLHIHGYRRRRLMPTGDLFRMSPRERMIARTYHQWPKRHPAHQPRRTIGDESEKEQSQATANDAAP